MEKLANLQDSSDERQRELRKELPDFVTKTKEYLKANPGMIREVAGAEIQQIETWLDTLPLGFGEMGKAKLNEFLGSGNGSGVQGGVKDASGQTFIPQGNQEPEHIKADEQEEIIERMAELSERGFDTAEISATIAQEFGIEYHYLTVRRMLKAYYTRPDNGDDNEKEPVSRPNLQIYKNLLDRNTELQKKVAELTAKVPQEVMKSEHRGIIRRFLAWLW